ncbi:hypothetical protein EMIHUDRAFT_457510 [Emiliania huxleyi CCMP1516]|uniref:non-specific serine/threonine protein kinase n=2 Tax=Emiliania huxleyi TaxID=2903 RepID=A0A0D3JQ13_EMIH1|nr:hypothetical protein EMIHUDRAFT_457510 [Emiliania huxleyi CCMP1516]EOD25598.1 hypothetical protein EMIHUDRAFT_457510 [Emiliania huxleyi CCMP1516]|eukprot:XP_005778027.1 hypothetical protein EMIHUDRAFT_457510 [Emiliania huxleyi CCMP1516]
MSEPRCFKRVGPYDLFTTLGQGSFAIVYRGQHRISKRTVAVKAIVRARLNQKLQANLEAEISILQTLQHPHIVRLHDVQTTERHVYLVMELCPGGDLLRVIRSQGAQTEAQTRGYMLQLVRGLAYLREHNLVHRDLKPQNLLLSSHLPDATLKIADFGFARYMQQADLAETLCGSPLYMAPEILRFHKYDAKADLWSVGTIAFELLTTRPPYTGANHVQLLQHIEASEVELPGGISQECASLLRSLLRRDPTQRLSFGSLFTHPFLYPPELSGGRPAFPSKALALHVKALDLTQQAMQLAPSQAPTAAGGSEALAPRDEAHEDVMRERFSTLLERAEWIRQQLRLTASEASRGGATTACVEELLYRHALGMGREAAVDEMVGKWAASRALYQRAKLLLEQLAEEPLVGAADRAVLSKYAAGFAWRLREIEEQLAEERGGD